MHHLGPCMFCAVNHCCRHMLVQVSKKLSESHLEELKYLFEAEGIPLKDLEEATSGLKLFQLLQYRGEL